MDNEETTLRKADDATLIRMWRDFSGSLDRMLQRDNLATAGTANVSRRLGYIEREMEWRGIRHDDPRGDVLDSHGVWHKA